MKKSTKIKKKQIKIINIKKEKSKKLGDQVKFQLFVSLQLIILYHNIYIYVKLKFQYYNFYYNSFILQNNNKKKKVFFSSFLL